MAERDEDLRPTEVEDGGLTEAAEADDDDRAVPGTSAPSIAFRSGG